MTQILLYDDKKKARRVMRRIIGLTARWLQGELLEVR